MSPGVVSVATRCAGQKTYGTSVDVDRTGWSNSRLGTRQYGDLGKSAENSNLTSDRLTSWDCRAGSVMVARVAAETVMDVAAPYVT
jgi:hypothetical protein